jgi:hypothetical protein
MPKHIVQWEVMIDDAETPEEAARQADELQRNPVTAATMVQVTPCDAQGRPLPAESVCIDLNDEPSDSLYSTPRI